MKRRGFLKALAAAPVAAPAIAAEAVAGGGLGSSAGKIAMPAVGSGAFFGDTSGPINDETQWARGQLAKLAGRSREQKEHERLQFTPDGIDPELAGMRSLSLSAKVRMSRDRQYERYNERRNRNLIARIAGWCF